ncbi:MAG: hypothetical protein D6728_17800 [Cyanobacteria bacterium J055]|nr:MAG: hypothetical protein D6728_17800 [Cyanobacteria bacterium J055]
MRNGNKRYYLLQFSKNWLPKIREILTAIECKSLLSKSQIVNFRIFRYQNHEVSPSFAVSQICFPSDISLLRNLSLLLAFCI